MFPKRILIRKPGFGIKSTFSQTNREPWGPFCIDVPIRSHALRTLEAGAARNREI